MFDIHCFQMETDNSPPAFPRGIIVGTSVAYNWIAFCFSSDD